MLWLLASSVCSACQEEDVHVSFSGFPAADRRAMGRGSGGAENDSLSSVIPACGADGKDLKCVSRAGGGLRGGGGVCI